MGNSDLNRRSLLALSTSALVMGHVGSAAAQDRQPRSSGALEWLVEALCTGDTTGIETHTHAEVVVPGDLVEGIEPFKFWIIKLNASLQEDYTNIEPTVRTAMDDGDWGVVYAEIAAVGRSSDMEWTHDWFFAAELEDGKIRILHESTNF